MKSDDCDEDPRFFGSPNYRQMRMYRGSRRRKGANDSATARSSAEPPRKRHSQPQERSERSTLANKRWVYDNEAPRVDLVKLVLRTKRQNPDARLLEIVDILEKMGHRMSPTTVSGIIWQKWREDWKAKQAAKRSGRIERLPFPD